MQFLTFKLLKCRKLYIAYSICMHTWMSICLCALSPSLPPGNTWESPQPFLFKMTSKTELSVIYIVVATSPTYEYPSCFFLLPSFLLWQTCAANTATVIAELTESVLFVLLSLRKTIEKKIFSFMWPGNLLVTAELHINKLAEHAR